MITKRNIARGMMAAGSLVYLLGIWRTCPLFSGKGYFLGVLVMGMFAVLAHHRAVLHHLSGGLRYRCRSAGYRTVECHSAAQRERVLWAGVFFEPVWRCCGTEKRA